jgi:hypothetical protein
MRIQLSNLLFDTIYDLLRIESEHQSLRNERCNGLVQSPCAFCSAVDPAALGYHEHPTPGPRFQNSLANELTVGVTDSVWIDQKLFGECTDARQGLIFGDPARKNGRAYLLDDLPVNRHVASRRD